MLFEAPREDTLLLFSLIAYYTFNPQHKRCKVNEEIGSGKKKKIKKYLFKMSYEWQ